MNAFRHLWFLIRMHRMRQLLLIILAVCALPVVAHAQDGYFHYFRRTEHDWRVSIGGSSFGLLQETIYNGVPIGRETTIYCGPLGKTTTRLRAPYIAVVLLLPVAAAGVLLVRGLSGKNESSNDPS